MSLSGTAYCTTTDVTNALSGLNSQGTPADMTTSLLQLAVEQATAKVSGQTGKIWGIDSSGNTVAVPDVIISITINIAAFLATLSYRKNKPLDTHDPVRLRYQDALTDLKAIQEGQMDPDPTSPDQPSGRPGRRINTIPKVFVPQDSGTRLERGRVFPQQVPGANMLPGQLGYLWI